MQPRNTQLIVFMLCSLGVILIWSQVHLALFPPIPPDEITEPEIKKPDTQARGPGFFATLARETTERIGRSNQQRQAQEELLVKPASTLGLGSPDPDSPFHLGVQLDPRGAGVRQVILNKFSAQDADGRPAPGVFTLVPGAANGGGTATNAGILNNGGVAANLLYHYAHVDASHPSDELGRMLWKVVGDPNKPTEEQLEDGRLRQKVEFKAEVAGVEVIKRYTLTAGEYHLGLEIQFTRTEETKGTKRFRYQLAGARGLPIEGKWYASTFRNSLIGQVEGGTVTRDYQDSRTIGVWGGGREVLRENKKFFRYAGVAVQYFASVVVVDDNQDRQDIIARVRPTLEKGVLRGALKSLAPDRSSFVFTSAGVDYTFRVLDPDLRLRLAPDIPAGARLAVTWYPSPNGRDVATAVEPEFETQALWEDDITVRLTSEALDLDVNKPVTHRFLLYNGPAKPSLLAMMTGTKAVQPQVVSRYIDALQLNSLVDHQFPGWVGDFSYSIYWTHLVIACTNLLHWVLHYLYMWVPNYGLCIILLTVLVRGLMFPLSRKQAMMAIKMQALAPELKALQARFGEDRQGLAVAQMDLYRRHGVSPFGTCWVLLLQMPIFMGLYYALQESIAFRNGDFWPTWIVNLAAPDMFLNWGRGIPIISRDMDYGGFLYLGPYLNILPILAIALMVVQQKLMSPPATDEAMEANQRVMTIMMCVMGLLFYKVAAGLCVYFIVSSVWGFAERAFLPKATKPGETPPAPQVVYVPASPAARVQATTATTTQDPRGRGKKGKKGRRPEERQTPVAAETPDEEQPTSTLGKLSQWWKKRRQHLREWWAKVLKDAEKK